MQFLITIRNSVILSVDTIKVQLFYAGSAVTAENGNCWGKVMQISLHYIENIIDNINSP